MNRKILSAFVALAALGTATTARADRVVLEPPNGTAVQERLDEVADALGVAIRAAGHEVQAVPPLGPGLPPAPLPTTSDEMRNIARQQAAQYVVTATVTPMPGQYRLLLRVGYAPIGRVEELEVNVVEAEEPARLADIVRSMVRPEGLGEDAVRLAAGDAEAQARLAAERERLAAEERARHEEEQRARLAREQEQRQQLLERERQRTAEREQRAREAWASRERYGVGERPWIILAGLDVRSLLAQPTGRDGGFFGAVELRGGYAIPGVPGLEARAGVDVVFGSISALTFTVGGVYLASPFTQPVFIGGGGDLGVFVGTTGARTAAFTARGGPMISWRAGPRFYVEGTVPELTYISASSGALAIGLSARAGVRF